MAKEVFTNELSSVLAEDLTSGETDIDVTAGDGASFPTLSNGDWSDLTITELGTGVKEVVRFTAKSTDTLTVTRNIGGTNQAFTTGDSIEQTIAASTMQNLAQRKDGRVVFASSSINLKTTADDVYTVTSGSVELPSNCRFIPLAVQVIILTSDTVTGDPQISLGTTTGGTDILTATAVTETNQWEVTTLSPTKTGVTAVYVSVKTGATATTLTGKVYIEGILAIVS